VAAIVTFDDGVFARWHFPRNGALIGEYRDYRWGKWEEAMLSPANSPLMWKAAAQWAAAREARPGHMITRVTLVQRVTPLAPPGVEPSEGPSQQRVFYALNFIPAANKGTVKPPASTPGGGL
jgi:hypothetical protein